MRTLWNEKQFAQLFYTEKNGKAKSFKEDNSIYFPYVFHKTHMEGNLYLKQDFKTKDFR